MWAHVSDTAQTPTSGLSLDFGVCCLEACLHFCVSLENTFKQICAICRVRIDNRLYFMYDLERQSLRHMTICMFIVIWAFRHVGKQSIWRTGATTSLTTSHFHIIIHKLIYEWKRKSNYYSNKLVCLNKFIFAIQHTFVMNITIKFVSSPNRTCFYTDCLQENNYSRTLFREGCVVLIKFIISGVV